MSSSVSGGGSPLVYASALAIEMPSFRLPPGADSLEAETRLCYEAITVKLASRGLSLDDVVKVNCYITDDAYREELVRVNRAMFAPGPYPVGTTVVLGLAGNARVQVEVIAAARD